jgi:hypothetical protein
MKAQVATEYIIILSLAMMMLVPLVVFSTQNLIDYKEDAKITAAKNTVKKIGESADWVYSQGPPAKLTVNACIPSETENITISGQLLSIMIRTSAGVSEVYFETTSIINGSLPTNEGCYPVSIVAHDSYVDIGVMR